MYKTRFLPHRKDSKSVLQGLRPTEWWMAGRAGDCGGCSVVCSGVAEGVQLWLGLELATKLLLLWTHKSISLVFSSDIFVICRSQWPRGLRRRSAAARLLRLWVRIPPGGMDVCLLWVLCVVRWRFLRRADHSSRGVLPTVMRRVYDLETSRIRGPWPAGGWGGAVASKTNKQTCLSLDSSAAVESGNLCVDRSRCP